MSGSLPGNGGSGELVLTSSLGLFQFRGWCRQPGNRRFGPAPSAAVRSPTVFRRQAVMFGLTTPVTCSISWMTEVWSNVSWQT